MRAISDRQESTMAESKGSLYPDDRVWYDQFTSTDWVHDIIADSHRVKALRSRKDFWGRVWVLFDGAQGWILSALVGFIVAVLAYVVDVTEATVFDFKDGYCARGWTISEKVGPGQTLDIIWAPNSQQDYRNAAPTGPAPTGETGARSLSGTPLARSGPSSPSTSPVPSPSPASRACSP